MRKYVANMSKLEGRPAVLTFKDYPAIMQWFRTLQANNFNRYTYEWTGYNTMTLYEKKDHPDD